MVTVKFKDENADLGLLNMEIGLDLWRGNTVINLIAPP